MPPQGITELLDALRTDRTIWASAPCGHEYRLSDSELFHGSKLTAKAKEFAAKLQLEMKGLRDEVKAYKYKLTAGFTKRSVEVKLGKTVEKICPVLPGFPYQPLDCRAMYDPIDYLAFVGATKGEVNHLDFVDVKTGNAQLKKVQREIRDAVLDGKVDVRRVGQ